MLSPPSGVQALAHFPVASHLAPAVTAPLASGHIDDEVPVLFAVEDAGIVGGFGTGAGREGIDHTLGNESSSGSDPGLMSVEVFLLFSMSIYTTSPKTG
jgi:hypothetical protein